MQHFPGGACNSGTIWLQWIQHLRDMATHEGRASRPSQHPF